MVALNAIILAKHAQEQVIKIVMNASSLEFVNQIIHVLAPRILLKIQHRRLAYVLYQINFQLKQIANHAINDVQPVLENLLISVVVVLPNYY